MLVATMLLDFAHEEEATASMAPLRAVEILGVSEWDGEISLLSLSLSLSVCALTSLAFIRVADADADTDTGMNLWAVIVGVMIRR